MTNKEKLIALEEEVKQKSAGMINSAYRVSNILFDEIGNNDVLDDEAKKKEREYIDTLHKFEQFKIRYRHGDVNPNAEYKG